MRSLRLDTPRFCSFVFEQPTRSRFLTLLVHESTVLRIHCLLHTLNSVHNANCESGITYSDCLMLLCGCLSSL